MEKYLKPFIISSYVKSAENRKSIFMSNSFPQEKENQNFNYNFLSTHIDGDSKAHGRWSEGKSIDGKGTFTFEKAVPHGRKPNLGKPHPAGFPKKNK